MSGQIDTGKVDAVLQYTGEGRHTLQPRLPVAANLGSKGYRMARMVVDDEELAKELPLWLSNQKIDSELFEREEQR